MPVSAFFSWPSKGELTEYLSDEATIEASEPYLASFLTSVAAAAKADRINIIAHSMGNRGLLRVAHRLANLSLPEGVRFGQIVLAAPDVDVQVFCDLATIYPSLSQRTTLYISAKDKALEASNWVHDYQRAGYCPPRTVVSGVDTVEVTNVDLTQLGHGYVGEAEAVLYDMFTLISSNTAPERRARLTEARTASAARYWTIGA
jgi:esterase/lipase superfamily enzyme